MKEETEKLKQKQTELTSKLKTIALPTKQEDCTIEALAQKDTINSGIANMIKNADKQIEIVASLQDLPTALQITPKKPKPN
jgi:hypothetical protein